MADDFKDRLESAIQRGQNRRDAQQNAARAKAISEEDAKRLHTAYRLSLSDRISQKVELLVSHFPGFRKETLFGEAGWGAGCYRDDLVLSGGKRDNRYSRLEITVRPFNEYRVLDLRAKGTVANKEVFNRNFYEPLTEGLGESFEKLIDSWVVEYAELYAAAQ